MASKKLLLFDLDGVLIDSKSNMKYAWSVVQRVAKVNVAFDNYFELIGRPFSEILKILSLDDNLEDIEDIFKCASLDRLDLVRFYPDVVNTLINMRENNIKLGVVTSKDYDRTNIILSKLPVDFTSIQTPNNKYRGKPAPDSILVAMAEAGVDPKDTVYIGDMLVDFEASVRAKVDYIHAEWGYQSIPFNQVVKIKSITELIEKIDII